MIPKLILGELVELLTRHEELKETVKEYNEIDGTLKKKLELLSVEDQKKLTLALMAVCFPHKHLHQNPVKGIKKPRNVTFLLPEE